MRPGYAGGGYAGGGRGPRYGGDGPAANAFGQDRLDDLEWLAGLMDDRFRVPGTRIRFGLDMLMGLVPVVGDTAGAAIGVYLIWRAARLGLPTWLLAAMAGNTALDWLLGLVPLVGDLLDLGYRSNRRNLNMLRRHLARRAEVARTQRRAGPAPGWSGGWQGARGQRPTG